MVLLAIRNVSRFPSPAIDVARHSWYSTGRFGSPLVSLRRLRFFESKQKQSSLSLVKEAVYYLLALRDFAMKS